MSAYGLTTRRPSLAGEAARLKDCESVSRGRMGVAVETHVVALLPCTSSTESETDCRGPRAALEEEDGEDDAEGETEAGADQHRREAAVPLGAAVSWWSANM